MRDKTQLDQIAEIVYAACSVEEWHIGVPRLAAQQILDICQPQWIEIDKQNPFEILTDETKGRVIFRFFHGKDYWTLEPPPPEDTA